MRDGHAILGGSTAFAFCMTAVITFWVNLHLNSAHIWE